MIGLPARILAAILAAGVAFGAGWGASSRHRDGIEAAQNLAQSEAARESERLAAQSMTRITDALTAQKLDALRTAGTLRDRLRQQSQAGASSAAVAACRDDEGATAARVVPDGIGADLVTLMERAEEVSAQLAACHAALIVR